MKMQRMVKMWLVVLAVGLWCVPAYGGLMANWNFAGTSGGNVTDLTGNGYNLTGYQWTTADPAKYFKLWSGTYLATVKYVPTAWGWASPFTVNGSTATEWTKASIDAYIGPLNGGEALKTKFAIGTGGNGDWVYGSNASQTVPTNEWTTLRYAWSFNETTHDISTSIWINEILVGGDPDLTPGAYPGLNVSTQWWMNKIALESALFEYGTAQLYNEYIIPEPATMILLSIGGIILSQKRKRV